MEWVVAGFYVVLAALNASLNVGYLRSVTANHRLRGANIGTIQDAIAWTPTVLLIVGAIGGGFYWQIVVADIIGGWIGTYIGIGREVSE